METVIPHAHKYPSGRHLVLRMFPCGHGVPHAAQPQEYYTFHRGIYDSTKSEESETSEEDDESEERKKLEEIINDSEISSIVAELLNSSTSESSSDSEDSMDSFLFSPPNTVSQVHGKERKTHTHSGYIRPPPLLQTRPYLFVSDITLFKRSLHKLPSSYFT